MPKVVSEGSSCLSSRTTFAVWRSPEASPATTASFMIWRAGGSPAVPPAAGRRRRADGGTAAGPAARRMRSCLSSEGERIHRPRYGNAANEEREEDNQKELDSLAPLALPQQREEDGGGDGVDEHQHNVA